MLLLLLLLPPPMPLMAACFPFTGQFFQQIDGVAVGLQLSPVTANSS
jgi:hypothetical protein